MPRTTDTRARMLRAAATLLRRQGYAATGWRQVVRESGTPWGSQAHHFPGGKTQLAAEAVQQAGAAYERLLRGLLQDRHPADAILAWSDAAASELAASGWTDGCPVATVTLETAHTSDDLAHACAAALESWQVALSDALTDRGLPAAAASSLAMVVVAGMEGALLLARANRDATPLQTVGGELAGLVRQHTGP